MRDLLIGAIVFGLYAIIGGAIVFGVCAIIDRVREQMRRDKVIEDSDTPESLR